MIIKPGRVPGSRFGRLAGAAGLMTCVSCSVVQGAAPEARPPASPAPVEVSVSSGGSAPANSRLTPNPATPQPTISPTSTPAAAELPRGGREVFPRYRLFGYAGLTGASTLGRLGTGPLDSRVVELQRRAKAYAHGREILPVLEVITTVVQSSPGRDGKYRVRISDAQIETYYEAAREHQALLLLNIQPGRSEFLPEARAYEKWLKRPDVGVALDPEWAMDPGQRPGGPYGHTTGAELNQVAAYLAKLVKKYDLPEKVMVYHQVAASVVRKESGLKKHDGVVLIKSVDGLGSPGSKINTYRVVNKTTPKFVHAGFKLFFTEDRERGGRLMSPKEVLALKPRPEYVLYE